MSSGPTLGIDLGGTNSRVAVVDGAGSVLAEAREATPPTFAELRSTIVRLASHVGRGQAPVVAVGVGAAGLVDGDGVVYHAPNTPALAQVALRAELVDALALPVVVDNDANVAAWGEVCHGAARGVEHALVITLGTGVGGGIVIGGRLYRGSQGFAGEVGHWQFDPLAGRCACGEPGHWEVVASGTGLGARARRAAATGRAPAVLARAGGEVDAVTGVHVGESARAGEPDGVEILEAWAVDVAIGFAGLVNVLDPALVVVSGGIVALGDVVLEPIRRAFTDRVQAARRRAPVPVVAAMLGDRAGVVGAAALARGLVA